MAHWAYWQHEEIADRIELMLDRYISTNLSHRDDLKCSVAFAIDENYEFVLCINFGTVDKLIFKMDEYYKYVTSIRHIDMENLIQAIHTEFENFLRNADEEYNNVILHTEFEINPVTSYGKRMKILSHVPQSTKVA